MDIHIPETYWAFHILQQYSQDDLLNIVEKGLKGLSQEKALRLETETEVRKIEYDTPLTSSYTYDTGELRDIKDLIFALSSEVYKINSLLGGGTKKGKVTEKVLCECLHKLFPDAEINDIGYQAGKGDIFVHYKNYNIMIEVKNYGTNVPRAEKDKFHRDLIQNDYSAGILVSCRSGIVGAPSNIEYKSIGNKFAVYLSYAGSNGESIMWAILFIVSSLKRISEESEQNKEVVTSYVRGKLMHVESCLEDVLSMTEGVYKIKSDVNRVLNVSVSNMETRISLTRQKLEALIKSFKLLLDTGEIDTDMSTLCLNSADISKGSVHNMTVAELKDKARLLGLKLSGTKNVLKERIEDFIKVKKKRKRKTVDDSSSSDEDDE